MNGKNAKKIRKIVAHTVQAALKPKPKFLPKWLWRAVVNRVVVLEKVAGGDDL